MVCPSPGPLFAETNYRFYYFESTNYTFGMAEDICAFNGSQLFTIHSQDEMAFFTASMIAATGNNSAMLY